MPLYIRDDAVEALASRLQQAIGVRTKTEAVRLALQSELDRVQQPTPMRERISRSLALADAMGDGAADFDFKAFRDGMWGE